MTGRSAGGWERRRTRHAHAAGPFVHPGDHAFAVAGGVMVDHALVAGRRSLVWVADIWPDGRARGGWARRGWRPGRAGRGVIVPADVTVGAVIEFGADQTRPFLPRRLARPCRWYGWVTGMTPGWLLVHGPHPGPGDALADAAAHLAPMRAIATRTVPAPHPSGGTRR